MDAYDIGLIPSAKRRDPELTAPSTRTRVAPHSRFTRQGKRTLYQGRLDTGLDRIRRGPCRAADQPGTGCRMTPRPTNNPAVSLSEPRPEAAPQSVERL